MPEPRVVRSCQQCPLSRTELPSPSVFGVVNLYCGAPRRNLSNVHYTGPEHGFALIVDPEATPPFCPLPVTLMRKDAP